MNMKLEGLIFGILSLLIVISVVISLLSFLRVRNLQKEIDDINLKNKNKNNVSPDRKKKSKRYKN